MLAGAGRKTKLTRREEQNAQIAIIKALALILTRATRVLHVPNGGYRTKAEGKILKAMGVMKGFPDLLFIHLGRCFGIELKLDNTDPSDDQIDAHAILTDAGMPLAVCRSLAEVLAQISAWNIPTRMKEGIAP